MSNRKYDVLVYGATGFTGELVCQYLAEKQHPDLKWAIVGRSQDKLDQLKTRHKLSVDTILADSNKPESLEAMCSQTKVVLTTVGPYLRYGEPLVKACLTQGTHYCDLTGELPFVHRMIESYHEEAGAQKVKIVHSCGFDSIPSDIGCLYLQEESQKHFKQPMSYVRYYLMGASGSLSRGTLESLMDVVAMAKDKKVRKMLGNVNALTSLKPLYGIDQKSMVYDSFLESWTAPFVMEGINSRIVRRSHDLLQQPWGADFQYGECMRTGNGAKGFLQGKIQHLLITGLALSALHPLSRKVVSSFLPEIGGGPSRQAIEKGFFKVSLMGGTENGAYRTQVNFKGPKDPGYGSTAMMLAESAISLAQDQGPTNFGVGTPATMIGLNLIDRLRSSGFKIEFHKL